MNRILYVEDDQSLALGLEFNLKSEGFDVTHCPDGQTARLALAIQPPFDLVILDWMLPDEDGISILKHIRTLDTDLPVMLLTARDASEDIVQGLDAGADDYLTKPFDLNVLMARVRNLLKGKIRRTKDDTGGTVEIGKTILRFDKMEAERAGIVERLTYKETMIMKLLWDKRMEIVTREDLLKKIWGVEGYMQTRTVDNHIVRLRKIFEPNPKRPQYILSAHGEGYSLRV